MKKYSIYIIIFIGICFSSALYSQSPVGEIISYNIKENTKDTILLNRKYGKWWFGLYGGPQYDLYFGELNTTLFPNEPNNPFDTSLTYTGGNGAGLYMGLIAEFIPPGEKISYSIRMSLLNFQNGTADTDTPEDSLETQYRFNSLMNYITISPSARYNFATEGLHVFGGLDIGIALSGNFDQEKYFVNSGDIEQNSSTDFDNLNFRFGASVGVGYDIFMVDVSSMVRVRFTPFASLHFGNSYISEDNSNWNSVTAKLGLQVKFGYDEIEYDTLFYDPNYRQPPQYLASLNTEEGITFPGISRLEAAPTAELDMVYVSRLQEAEKPVEQDTTLIATADVPDEPRPEPENTVQIIEDTPERFTFANSTSTELRKDAKEYLDQIARYLKSNPNTTVRIEGHTDNTGATLTINQQRSEARANAAVEYLMSKGIPRGRIFSRGRGALQPFKPNATPEGRRANNRVEIVVFSN